MAKEGKSLSYFMREAAKEPEIVEVPGVEGIKDEEGNIVPFKIRILNQKEISDIYDKYRKRTMVFDKRGNPYTRGNEAVFKTESDSARALRHIIVEALQYPDLRDKDLMEFYKCYDITEMPLKVFPNPEEYQHVERSVLSALGIMEYENDDEVEDAKNS